MKCEYLLFNLIVLAGPVIGGLIYHKTVWPKSKGFLLALIIPAIIFSVTDSLVTGYFWKFNDRYITGFRIANLPVEEILFFLIVPFSCLFLWINWKKNDQLIIKRYWLRIIGLGLLIAGLFSFYQGWFYSGIIFSIYGIWLMVDSQQKKCITARKDYLWFIALVLILTLIFNGYLTARPVVIYNPLIKTNINLYTVPVEDFFYGLLLVNFNLIIYNHFKSKK